MTELLLTLALFCCVILLFMFMLPKKINDSIDESDLDENEKVLLTAIDEEYHEDIIQYVRTLTMTKRLAEYSTNNKTILEALSYFIMTKYAQTNDKKEQENITKLTKEKQNEYVVNKIKQSVSYWNKSSE